MAATPARAELDLRRAGVNHLDNGLTVIVLEEHSQPVVSVQALYRTGARDEMAGKTGLAHFLEHLAFRASENFPRGAGTDAIYDAGGEWHGYTWLDQTTYFATMPSDGLDLLLRIEADRMAGVTIDPAAIEAERGAVLTEMHGYENDPASVLFDAVAATALQTHPYRNNTIGSESDVRALSAEDARRFYETRYAPANAVLAIVGDVTPERALTLVRQYFASLPARPSANRVAAVEPPQRRERRIVVTGPDPRQHVELAFPAPPASSADFPAFLVLQQLLSGSAGANFGEEDAGTPAVEGSALYGVADDIASWVIPTAYPYLFTITASAPAGADRAALEQALERRIAPLSLTPVESDRLDAARAEVARQLALDIQTTESAAHQLAFFEGIGAYDALMVLPERVAAVRAEDVQRVAGIYLDPHRRTVGWYVPGPPMPAASEAPAAPPRAIEVAGALAHAADRPARPPTSVQIQAPIVRRLRGGLPVIIRPNPLAPTAALLLLASAPIEGEDSANGLAGYGAIHRETVAADLWTLVAVGATALRLMRAAPVPTPSDDPQTRLQQMIDAQVGLSVVATPRPLLAVVSGAVDPAEALEMLEFHMGRVRPAGSAATRRPAPVRMRSVSVHIARPLAQAALGYAVPAPPPATRQGLAWRMLLYVLTHAYGGRLGDSAIRDRGLIYYVDSDYRSDGARGWITLSIGVDPSRIDAMEAALRAELARLASEPPSAAEVEAARRHLLGRDVSAAQSNEEIADRLAQQFVETGGLRSHDELAAMLAQIGPAEVAAAIPAFIRGNVLRVDVGEAPAGTDR